MAACSVLVLDTCKPAACLYSVLLPARRVTSSTVSSRRTVTVWACLMYRVFCVACCQVDFVKMLYDQMVTLHTQFADTPRGINFPRPSFKVCL